MMELNGIKRILEDSKPIHSSYSICGNFSCQFFWYDKICPYEAVISHHIFKEVAEFYHKGILPKSSSIGPRIPSTIIKLNLAIIMVNWINKNDSTTYLYNNKYKFDLIYLKSQDGFDCKTFNKKCNGQEPIVVLLKVQSKKNLWRLQSNWLYINHYLQIVLSFLLKMMKIFIIWKLEG